MGRWHPDCSRGFHRILLFSYNWSFFAACDTLTCLNLPMTKAWGQCYDGGSNMCGLRKGVATQLQADKPRAIYTHCYGHSLTLAASDTIMRCQCNQNCTGNNTWSKQADQVLTSKRAVALRNQGGDCTWHPWGMSPMPYKMNCLGWLYDKYYSELMFWMRYGKKQVVS